MEDKNFEYKISITGDLGSGKSTVCSIIAKKTGAEVVSIGTIQRAMAKQMNMTTYEFNRYMETHPKIDNQFDNKLKEYDCVFGKNMLFDSRLAWNFVPSAFSVYLTVDLMEAARRVYNARRENEGYSNIEEAMTKLAERRASETFRYSTLYGLDLMDMSNYDLVVDSTSAPPKEIVNAILSSCEGHAKDGKKRLLISPMRLYPLANAEIEGEIKVVLSDGFYFVSSGLNELKSEISNGENLVACTFGEDALPTYIAQECTILQLKKWEEENKFKFIRYPSTIK